MTWNDKKIESAFKNDKRIQALDPAELFATGSADDLLISATLTISLL
jgi:hypothetical protein